MPLLKQRIISHYLLSIFSGCLLICLSENGCATIIRGANQSVEITSIPSGASVSIDYQPQGKTPFLTKLSRQDQHDVKIELPGYHPFEAVISKKITKGWVLASTALGFGFVGLAIDLMSGSLYGLSPEQISATLKSKDIGLMEGENSICVIAVLEPEPTWEKIGNLRRLEGISE